MKIRCFILASLSAATSEAINLRADDFIPDRMDAFEHSEAHRGLAQTEGEASAEAQSTAEIQSEIDAVLEKNVNE